MLYVFHHPCSYPVWPELLYWRVVVSTYSVSGPLNRMEQNTSILRASPGVIPSTDNCPCMKSVRSKMCLMNWKYLKYAVFCVSCYRSTWYPICSKQRKEREDAGTEVGFLSTFPTICWIKRLKESLKRDVLPQQQIKLMAPVYSNYLFKGLMWN